MKRTITDITIYWDTTGQQESWAYRASDGLGLVDSGPIDGIDDDDLDGAIGDACSQLGVDVRVDAFAREPIIEGGYATWAREGEK